MTITDRSPRPGRSSPAACSSRRPGTTAANRVSARRSPTAKKDSPITSCRSPTAANTACTTSTRACERAASTTTSRPSRSPGSCRASSGPPRPHPDPAASPQQTAAPPAQEAGTPGRHSGRHARSRYGQHPSRVPRSFLDPRTAGSRNRAMGYQKNPRISDWQRRHRARRPALLRQPAPPSPRPVHGETSACPLDKRAAISAYVPVPLLPEGQIVLDALTALDGGRGGQRRGLAAPRLDRGLLVTADDVVAGMQKLALPTAGGQVKDAAGLLGEAGVAGEDPGAVLPRLDRIL